MKNKDKVNNKKIGNVGEDHAVAFLENGGYRILCRNYRTKRGEIDIIAKKRGVVHVVEVKTSGLTSPIMPEENYTKAKSGQVYRMASLFLAKEGMEDLPMQIDLIAVRVTENHEIDSLHYYERVTGGN
jgi:putative endonuclease